MADEESGELTLSLDLMNYDGKTLTGSYDCRAPICATRENLYETAEQNMKKGGFAMEGSAMFPPHHSRPTARLSRPCCSATRMSLENQANHLRSAAERMCII